MDSLTLLKTRFAPTPSGYLHLGNAFSFVLTWLYARTHKGNIHLRIDDIDTQRSRLEYIEDIFESLEWLGLDWDSGAESPDDFSKNHSQTLHLEEYAQALELLKQYANLYACNCSRKKIKDNADENGQYAAHCLHKSLEHHKSGVALRIHLPTSANQVCFYDLEKKGNYQLNLLEIMRDFVVWGKNKMPAYQLTSLVDDTRLGINFVVRGEDLLPSTAAQVYMAGLLPVWNSFKQNIFLHHTLLKDTQGNKLSKSAGSFTLKDWRNTGKKREDLFLYLSTLLHLPPCTHTVELLDAFKDKQIDSSF